MKKLHYKKVNLALLFLALVYCLNCGTTALKFSDWVYARDSIGCSKGTEHLSTFTFYAALLGLIVDLLIGGFVYFIFRLFSKPKNHGYLIALLILYGLLSIVISTQYLWIFDRSPSCAFDFQANSAKLKTYSAYGTLSEINRVSNFNRIPEECHSLQGRLVSLRDEQLLKSISAKNKLPTSFLVYDQDKKVFSAGSFDSTNQWQRDLTEGVKHAYCILP